MADEPILLFKRVLGSLRPFNAAAEDALQSLEGAVRVRITKANGNTKRMQLYWASLHSAAPILSAQCDGDALTADLLHRVLKDRAGLVKLVTLPSGDVVKDYDSVSFAKMTEPERAKFIDWSLDTLSKWLGVEVQHLREEAA